MEAGKDKMQQMSAVRQRSDTNASEMLNLFTKFEDLAVNYYSNDDPEKKILTHQKASDLPDNISATSDKAKNSYIDSYMWFKGEYLDVCGMYEALQGREAV